MITTIFSILMIMVFGKILVFGLKMSWGIIKFIGCLIFAPIAIILMFATGAVYVAFFALIIIGVAALFKSIARCF